MNILITHVSYHAAIGIIKQLRQLKNINLIGTSGIMYGYSSGSLLVDKFYPVPSDSDNNSYCKFLQNIIDLERIDCIFTADENDLLLFNSKPEIFQKLICNADSECINTFTDKLVGTIEMSKLNVPIPPIYSIRDLEKMPASTKIIIRDRVGCCSKGIIITDNSNRKLMGFELSDRRFIQKYIEGNEFTVDVFCDTKGEPKIIVPRERLAIRSGITYKCKIVENKQLIELCRLIYSRFCIPGFSNVQFIIDQQNVAHFIELNPRIGGTTIASSLASINWPQLYIENILLKKQLKSYEHYMSLVRWNAVVTRYYEEMIYYEK